MKTTLASILCSLPLLASAAQVSVEWDSVPTNYWDWAGSTNNGQLTISYFVFRSDAVTGPWLCVGSTTNATHFIVNLAPCEQFFYVAASNQWGLSTQSNLARMSAPATNALPTRARKVP